MMNAAIKLKWDGFFRKLLNGHSERRNDRLIKSNSAEERSISILQKHYETNHLMLDPPFAQSVPINGALQDTSPPWNQQFVIGPFQAVPGIRLIKRKTQEKSESPERVTQHTDRD